MVDGGSWLSVVRVLMSWSPGPGQPGSTQCCSQSLWSSPAGSWATADTQTCLNYQTINCLLNPSFSAFDHASWKYLTSQSLNNCHKFQWASFSAIQSIFKLHVLSCCKMPQISETASVISQSPHICKLRIERIWQNTPISCSYFSLVSLWMLRKYCHCSLFSCKSALFDKIGNISFKTTLVIG